MSIQRIIGLEMSRDSSSRVENSDPDKLISAIRWLLFLTTALIVFGLTMLYSASYGQAGLTYFKKQLLWMVLGLMAAGVVIFIGYRKLASLSSLWMAICFIALLIATFCFEPVKGASRWLRLPGGISIQPSEFAKIAVLLFVANYCNENPRTFSNLKGRTGILPMATATALVIGAILLGRDLGTSVLVIASVSMALFVAGVYLRYMVIPLFFLVAASLYVYLFDPVRMARVTSFLHPESMQAEEGYQLWISLMALGSGEWFGTGFMASRMKAQYLPEAHTDFILSVIGEELGFVAMALLIITYAAWSFFALRISLNANSRLGTILGFAVGGCITMQATINIAVVSGSVPTKGMPAPFISFGGSHTISALIAVGLLLSIAIDSLYPGYSQRLQDKMKSFLRLNKRDAHE